MPDSTPIDEQIFKAVKFINEDKSNEAEETIESLLKNPETEKLLKTKHFQNIADVYLILGKFELARNTYLKADNPAGTAFSSLFLKEIQKAKELLSNTPDSPAKFWCLFLIDIFTENKNIQRYPGFFEIRHFLEITIYLLLKSKNQYYIDLILKSLKKLLDKNLDSEKYIGLAYFHFGDLDNAITFLNNSIKRNVYDGEIYLILGKLYLEKRSVHEAVCMLENAVLCLPEHIPSKELLEKAKSMLKEA